MLRWSPEMRSSSLRTARRNQTQQRLRLRQRSRLCNRSCSSVAFSSSRCIMFELVGPKAMLVSLEARWDSLSHYARRQVLLRDANDITTALMAAGSIDWLPSSFALALKGVGMWDERMATRAAAAKIKFDLLATC
eukprot:2562350-Pleurochrysis_carterae.AAC.2